MKVDNKILITGSTGLVGSAVLSFLKKKNIKTYFSHLDNNLIS